MARSRRRSGRGGGGALLGGVLIVVSLAVAAGFGYFYFTVEREQLDPTSLCPVAGPVAQMLVLADMTDPVDRSQLDAARAMIDRGIAEAVPGTRISLALISPDAAVRGAIAFSMCKPRSGAEASDLYENPAQIAARHRQGFEAPLSATLTEMLASPNAETSPIMESIQAAVSAAPGFLTFEGPRTLVLFSDLMQHGALMSFYRGDDWRSFQMSGAAARFAHSLNGAKVVLLRIPRPKAPVENVDDFWSRYFDAQGAARIEVHVIGDL